MLYGKSLFYLLLGGAAAGGASIIARANASIAIFQVPFSRFSILIQLPWMVLSLTELTELALVKFVTGARPSG